MYDLERTSGLPLQADDKGGLLFGPGLSSVAPDIRRRRDMLEVLFEPEAAGPEELYYMYRGVCRETDSTLIRQHGLRYDVTILRPGTVGSEYIKTAGHYHPIKPGTEFTYPEVYEVLHGRAHYLLQTEPDEEGVEAVLMEATAGDKVLIPPGYGHITINPGPGWLVMSNWVAEGFASLYAPIKELGGGAYFALAGNGEEERLVVNPRYRPTPRISARRPADLPEFGLVRGRPMYFAFLESPEMFAYLANPENYF
ncbi:MAG: Glucose-6-phosphate isomerase [Syntrophomonadaceae bacterium]|nr:Glucose-6-phosphate isomerase [Bacillota bacterium]